MCWCFCRGLARSCGAKRRLASLAARQGHALLPLFGDLPAEQQDLVLADVGRRKIILATNVAETSLTIDGVTAVIDSGQARQMHVSGATGLPRLELVPISQASAEQRAGRAGRTAPGVCWRLWTQASHSSRPPAETPEILRGDLAQPLLQLLTLGEADDFPWLDAPTPDALENARRLLRLLGATDDAGQVTALGRELSRLPAHPRLGRLLIAGAEHGVLRETSIAAALLSERDPFRAAEQGRRGPRDHGTVCSRSDVVDRVIALQAFYAGQPVRDPHLELHPGGARNVLRTAEQLYHLVDVPLAARAEQVDVALMQTLLDAFPDRLAKLRAGTQDRALMVGGRGVRLDFGSRVRGEPLLLAIDINDVGGEARARMASAVEREWLRSDMLRMSDELFFNPTRQQVEARARTYWVDLMLEESPAAIKDMPAAAAILAESRSTESGGSVAGGGFAKRASSWRALRWLADARPDLELPAIDDAVRWSKCCPNCAWG